jgi:hypothetical protein
MSIIGGLVDTHHDMELTGSSQLLERTWLARHLWTVLAVGLATLGAAAAWVLDFEP